LKHIFAITVQTSYNKRLHPETIYCKVFQKGESGEGLKPNFTVIGVFSASVAEM